MVWVGHHSILQTGVVGLIQGWTIFVEGRRCKDMKLAILVLTVLCLLLLGLLVIMLRQIRSILGQLKTIEPNQLSNMQLRLDEAAPGFDKLLVGINRLLNHSRKVNRDLERQKRNLQSQITSISHDLRTPLTSILGYLELAESSESAEERGLYIDVVKRKAIILQNLITDFYELSQLEEEEYPLELETVSCVPLLEDTVLTFYQDFIRRGLKLELDIQETPPIRLSRKELVRVYTNLIQNIIKHAKIHARIFHGQLNGQIVTILENDLDSQVVLEPQRLFERFYTVDPSRHGSGTGLGLYIARILLGKMGHQIKAAQSGQLIRFVITYGTSAPPSRSVLD